MGDWGRGQIRAVGDPDSQIYRETTPHCLSVLFWKGAAWRTPEKGRRGGGGAGVELALGVLLFLTVGTMELDLDRCVFGVGVGSRGCQPCFWNVRRENRVASL